MTGDNFFVPLGNTKPYLKLALEGEAGSGKSWTAALFAAGLHKKLKSTKPIAILDTEKAAKFLVPMFKKEGVEAVVRETHALSDLVKALELGAQGAFDVLVLDSITHLWMNLMDSYLKANNQTEMELSDWIPLKSIWKRQFSDVVVNSPIHIIATGRAGDKFEEVENPKKPGTFRLMKTGVKMQAEKNAAYEFDMLFLMERMELLRTKKREVFRQATVLKGRGDLLDGAVFRNPTFKHIEKAVDVILNLPQVAATQASGGDDRDLVPGRDTEKWHWLQDKKRWLEEIQNLLSAAFTTGADDKKLKLTVMQDVFGATADAALEQMQPHELKDGYVTLIDQLVKYGKAEYVEQPGGRRGYELVSKVNGNGSKKLSLAEAEAMLGGNAEAAPAEQAA